jgi:hypothetical protein
MIFGGATLGSTSLGYGIEPELVIDNDIVVTSSVTVSVTTQPPTITGRAIIVLAPVTITVIAQDVELSGFSVVIVQDTDVFPNITIEYGATFVQTDYITVTDSLAVNVSTADIEFYQDYRFRPTKLWSGYSSDGTNITLPIAQLPGLSVAEADAATGDWRDIIQAVILHSANYSKMYIDTPISEQLDTYKIFKKDLYGRMINSYFTVKFLTNMGEPNVAPEP